MTDQTATRLRCCVAVTGATGFLGFQIVRRLLAGGAAVVALHRSGSDCSRLRAEGVRCVLAPLEDESAMARGCSGAEVLIHAAGAVDFGGDAARLRAVNVDGTRKVLAAARRAGVRRVVHISSIVAVGASRRPVVLDETAPWNLGERRVPYVSSKREAEIVALAAAAQGQDVVVVNPASIVGPEDYTESEFGALCRRFWRGRVPVHFGGGNNFVDVRDVADGVVAAVQYGRTGQRYILGGENLTYRRFFAALADAAGQRRRPLRLPRWLAYVIAHWPRRPSPSSGPPPLTPAQARLAGWYFFYDCAKARRELGFHPRPVPESLNDAYVFWRRWRAAARQGDRHAA